MSNNSKKSLTRKESNMSVTLNERIRTLRESLKLTQADLAHELGVSRLTYIAIERKRWRSFLPSLTRKRKKPK